jgi:hypothetical protein
MKNQKYLWIMMILAVGAMWFLFHKSPSPTAQQEPVTNAVVAVNSIPSSPVSNQPPVASVAPNISNEEAAITAKYRQSLIGKDEAVTEIMKLKNKNLDIYGKVVDQYGQPVVGASVRGDSTLITGYMKNTVEHHSAVTDTDGRFSFLGLYGDGIGIWPQKEGYFYNLRLPSKRPDNYQPDPNNPVVFTMWKIRGAQPLVGSSINAKIPHDSNPATFEMLTGKPSSAGDLRVTLSQLPLEVKTGRERFDWTVKVEIMNGGLVEENDSYPYMAPTNGYQSAFEFNVSSNAPDWVPDLKKNFYIKNAQGQYGIMQFGVYPGCPPTKFEASVTINPSGSQDLEPATAQ